MSRLIPQNVCDNCKIAKYCSDKDHVINCFVKSDLEIMAEQIRAEVIEEIKELIKTKLVDNLMLEDATKYGNKNAKQQANSYATVMKYEIADCVDDLLDDLEQLKEQKNDKFRSNQ